LNAISIEAKGSRGVECMGVVLDKRNMVWSLNADKLRIPANEV
jgi:hypothetical protein